MLTPSQFKVRLHMSTLSKSDSTRGYRLRLVAASGDPILYGFPTVDEQVTPEQKRVRSSATACVMTLRRWLVQMRDQAEAS